MKKYLYKAILTFSTLLFLNGFAMGKEILITPFGQSPDGMMIRVVLKKVGYKADLNKTMTANELSDEKVIILAVGGSSKGMGAAGLDKSGEIARVEKLVEVAKKQGKKIIVMHIGGMGRRGKLTDIFLSKSVPIADKVIIVESGNSDGLFTNLLDGKNVDLLMAKSVKKTSVPLKKVLKAWGIDSKK